MYISIDTGVSENGAFSHMNSHFNTENHDKLINQWNLMDLGFTNGVVINQ